MAGEIPSNQPEIVAKPAETDRNALRRYMGKYESLAEQRFFCGISKDQILEVAVFRDGVTLGDVAVAYGRGLRNGDGDFSEEMRQCAIEWEKVLGLRVDTYDRFEQILREQARVNANR